MAGLPCDACGEESLVIPTGEVGEDAEGQTIYRRFRVCINPACTKYRHRRESIEFYLPQTGDPKVMDTAQLRPYLPEEDRGGGSQPSLFGSS